MRSHGTRERTLRAHATSRRSGRKTAPAALVCLGALLTAGCGASGDDGYVAVGAAGPSGHGDSSSSGPVRPDDKVRLVPLDERGDGGAKGKRGKGGADSSKDTEAGEDGDGAAGGQDSAGRDSGGGSSSGSGSGSGPGSGDGGTAAGGGSATGGGSGGTPGSGSPDSPGGSETPGGSGGGGEQTGGSSGSGGPAVLKAGTPKRAKADDRWCEKVTVTFRNTGGSPVTEGKVTFGTHIIDSLGIDWATRESTRALPVPIGAGEKREKTWTVCVDEWRVPLGMHIETREVKLSGWK
jgi:hypothetical protein